MKRLNTVPMRFLATMLLILCAMSASAQYYMNIRQPVGTHLRYAVSAVDSVWFEKNEQQEPSVKNEYDLNVRQTDGTLLSYAVSAVDSVWFDEEEQQEPSGNYEYVDMGLSVKWATFNVGASAPEEYGDYFAWGETEPYYESGYAQEDPQAHWKNGKMAGYAWPNYKYCNGSYYALTKYCSKISYGNYVFTDTKTTLDPEDDVAHVKWGGDWRMPTQAEFKELFNNSTWTWTTQNGVDGYQVTSKKTGYEGASIFLPAAGYRKGSSLRYVGFDGFYWLSSLRMDAPNYAIYLNFNSGSHNSFTSERSNGQSIRPVCPSVIVMKLDAEYVSLKPDDEITLSAVVEKDGRAVDFKVQWSSDNPGVATVSDDGVVKGLSKGTALITAEYYGHTVACKVTVTKPDGSLYEYVDLGLSVKWATFNVGAAVPEEYGDYFAWGETEPYYKPGYAHWKDSKSAGYAWSSYKYCKGSENTMTKYCDNRYNGYNGFADTKTTLDLDDDVAHVKWGGDWRMPTGAEFYELFNNCTCTWTTRNGVNGYLVTSKKTGYEGASIFLPAAGFRYGTSLDGVGSYGEYWSSSLITDCPSYGREFHFDSYYFSLADYRYYGLSVRPVCPSDTVVKLDAESVSLQPNDEITLTAVVEKYGQAVDSKVQWSSDNTGVASVSADGVVKGLSEGTALITAEYYGHTATCRVTVIKPDVAIYEYVDLGLSVKWATFNVGATKQEEYGDYFAWGETEPYYESAYAQEDPQAHWKEGKSDGYAWSWLNYKYCKGSDSTMSKYCNDSEYGFNGFTDTKATLDPDDDVAHVKWGGNWRMPTYAEFDELCNTENCSWAWTTQNGVNGYLVTSKISGHEGVYIFLPAAGYRSFRSLCNLGSRGDYWSSSLYTSEPFCARTLYFDSYYHPGANSYFSRYVGLSVRPVCP